MTLLSSLPVPRQHVLEKLVHHPRDGGRRNLKDDARRRAGKKSGQSAQSVDRPCRRRDAVDVATLPRDGAAFLRVQQRLADIEGGRQPGGDGAGKPAGNHVRHWPVFPVAVYQILGELVHDEVEALIRDVEHQLRAETVVERSPAFLDENLARAVETRPVRRSVNLQTLFNHCNQQRSLLTRGQVDLTLSTVRLYCALKIIV